jgi:membrane protein
VIKETFVSWSNHKCSTFGAAIAYYSIFSFGPLLLIITVIAGTVFGPDVVRSGVLATIFGIGTLLFAAVGVVAQLKAALNTVWDVEPSPEAGLWEFAWSYLVSLAGVVSLGFLLLVSLIFTAALAAAGDFVAPYMPEGTLQFGGSLISFAFITVLFAMMFKWLPDTRIHWHDVWFGAALTAVLFELGKFLIGFYVGKLGLESTYGAATSLVMLLIWVYYSAQIVLLGAEFTHVYARRHGHDKDRAGPGQDADLNDRNDAGPSSRTPIR